MATEPSDLERKLIMDVCREYRHWAPEQPSAPRFERMLGGGLSNRSVVLRGTSARWVLRLASTAMQSVDRKRELACHRVAAERGLAPAVRFADPARGLLLTDFIGDDPAVPGDDRGCLLRLATLLRSIHRLPARGPALASPAVLRRAREGIPPESPPAILIDAHWERFAAAGQRCRESDIPAVLCHNDLLSANRLHRDGRMLAIDWEYAAPGDAFFDLAVCASQLSAQAAESLLSQYLERPATVRERQQLSDQMLIYRGIEACWLQQRMPDARETHQSLESLGQMLGEPKTR